MVFFFKQKTAYEFRISDWSSDVCSSDLEPGLGGERFIASGRFMKLIEVGQVLRDALPAGHARKVPTKVMPGWMVNLLSLFNPEIGRASCRERVCPYVSMSVVAGPSTKKQHHTKHTHIHANTISTK